MLSKLLSLLNKNFSEPPEEIAVEKKFMEKRSEKRMQPKLDVALEAGGFKVIVHDMSMNGGIRVEQQGGFKFREKDELELKFQRLQTVLVQKGSVLWSRGDHAGLRVTDPGKDYREFIRNILTPQFLGESLHEINSSVMADEKKGNVRWWQGKGDTNIFVWSDEQGIYQLQIVFMDSILEWKRGSDMRQGELKGEAAKPGLGRVDPHYIVFYEDQDCGLLEKALSLITSSSVEAGVRDFISDEIKKTSSRSLLRFPVKNALLKCGEEEYIVTDISYSGLRVSERAVLKSDTGVLYLDEGRLQIGVKLEVMHAGADFTGLKIEISTGEKDFITYLRSLS